MTEYGYNNLPEEMARTALPGRLWRSALDALDDVVGIEDASWEARAAYLYDRKGWMAMDPFGEERSPYGSETDDVLLQVTVRIPFHSVPESVRGLALDTATLRTRERRTRLLSEIALAEGAAQAAQAEAAAKRAELEGL